MAMSLFILLISTILIATVTANRSGYGEICNSTAKCNKAAWLACQDNICVCSRYNDMIYDPAQRSCVVSAGERCRIAIGEDEDGRHMRYDVLKCVSNAACGSEGICKCGTGTFETDDGFCSLKKGYLSNCNSTNQCAEGELLSCVAGICGCDPETSQYIRNGDDLYDGYNNYQRNGNRFTQCAGLPGKKCLNKRCVANAFCETSTNACKCKDSFTESAKGCLPGFGHACSIGVPCASSLNCVEKVCRCKYPSSQYLYGGRCISFAGGPCEPSETGRCASNSECITTDSYSSCECKPGYIQTLEGFCDVDYGSPCPISPAQIQYSPFRTTKPYSYTGLDVYFTEQCNRRIPLTCVNGVCDCPDSGMIYDNDRATCVWLVGFKCDGIEDECVENAICRVVKPGNPKRCVCSDGFVTEADRTCSEHEGSTIDLEAELNLAKNISAEVGEY